MRHFPPSDRSRRQVPSRRVGLLVGRQTADGSSRDQTPERRLLAGASSSGRAAVARSLTHREGLRQRGHLRLMGPVVVVVVCVGGFGGPDVGWRGPAHTMSDDNNTHRRGGGGSVNIQMSVR